MSGRSPGHEWMPHEREGWSVCSRCGMVRNYDRETTTCSGALPKIRQRSGIEDCGPGYWQTRAMDAEREAARWRQDLAEALWKLGPGACDLCEGRWWVGEQPCTCAGGRLAADGGWPVGGSSDEGGAR